MPAWPLRPISLLAHVGPSWPTCTSNGDFGPKISSYLSERRLTSVDGIAVKKSAAIEPKAERSASGGHQIQLQHYYAELQHTQLPPRGFPEYLSRRCNHAICNGVMPQWHAFFACCCLIYTN
jgi:hypothetical protein